MATIRKVLIANRGEIARRVMRTCRAMGIATAAVYSDADRRAPFVRQADEAVRIGSAPSADSYLAGDKIIQAALRLSADAIHPGYGFLSENADFAQACVDNGLIFIGPKPEVIRRMGSKVESKIIMAAAGVPTIPGFSAEALSEQEIARQARELGYPVLIKASAGGGGKGMRLVHHPEELTPAMQAARREAGQAFGVDTLLIERYFDSPRHIEFQIVGDQYGSLIHCFERECSIQRRYQKIIEEAPCAALTHEMRARMAAAAVAAGRALGYSNAGTVEFVVDQGGQYYFLEVNTRLQVEHPVTEEITGLDLVRLQILAAQGEPLPVRQEELCLRGHAVEARLYAEDPLADFLPATGAVLRWEEPRLTGVRWESGVETGSEITIHYDPLLAKVIAHAPTRAEAARKLAEALAQLTLHGVRTNLPLLIEVLGHPEFLAGRIDTHFIDKHISLTRRRSPSQRETERVHAIASALWLQEGRRAQAPVLRSLPSGWRNNFSRMQQIGFAGGDDLIQVMYRVRSRGKVEVTVDGATHQAAVLAWDQEQIEMELDGIRRLYRMTADKNKVYTQSPLGTSELRRMSRLPSAERAVVSGGYNAPMPGKIISIRVEVGRLVKKGDGLIVLEAMKMEHEVRAYRDGIVRAVSTSVGRQVESGDILIVIDDLAEADVG